MKKVWFIRHAESAANANPNHRSASADSIELSSVGLEQAKGVSKLFNTAPNLIVTSPYLRTKQTARGLLERFPEVSHEEWPVFEFSYLSPLKYNNSTPEERRPHAKKFWETCDPQYCDGDGAESFSDLLNRAEKVYKKIIEREENFIVIFSHGQFMSAFDWLIKNDHSGADSENMREFYDLLKTDEIPNTGRLEFIFDK